MTEMLRVDRREGVVTLTLNRPSRKNALNRELLEEFTVVCREIAGLAHDDRVVVITGGRESFCSGADLIGQSRDVHLLHGMRLTGDACLALHQLPQPTIASVQGVAVGAGFSLAIACDLVIAADTARFSTMYTERGLSADFGASWTLPRLVGLQKAKELVYLPDFFSAEQAQDMGLVNRVVAPDELDEFVAGWARRLACAPAIALSQSKRLLDDAFSTDLASALEAEARAQVVNFSTEDAKEAVAAFRERRPPRFTGR